MALAASSKRGRGKKMDLSTGIPIAWSTNATLVLPELSSNSSFSLYDYNVKCPFPPKRGVVKFEVCGGLNNIVLSILNAVETAKSLNYYICPPKLYFDFVISPYRVANRRFSEIFDEDYFYDQLYKERGVCGIRSWTGESLRYCSNIKKSRKIPTRDIRTHVLRNTLRRVVRGRNLSYYKSYRHCPFHQGMANMSDSNWMRPAPYLMAYVQEVQRALRAVMEQPGPDGTKMTMLIALHLRIENDFKDHCKPFGCWRTPLQIVQVSCNYFKVPCKEAAVYVMTGAKRSSYMPTLQRYFGAVVDKETLLGQEVQLGRERNAIIDLEVAKGADLALIQKHSTFSKALQEVRTKAGKLSLYFSHDSNLTCVPANQRYMQAYNLTWMLPQTEKDCEYNGNPAARARALRRPKRRLA